jgi:hypothetical protein
LYLSIRKAIKQTNNYRGISLLPVMYKILSNILLSRQTPHPEEVVWDHQADFDATEQLLIIYYTFIKYLRENGNTIKQCIKYL